MSNHSRSQSVCDLRRGGGTCVQVCTAVQGMVFKPFCQEQDIGNMHYRSGIGCQI